MRPLQASGLPTILLTLLMAFGVVLPEAGHSLAHRQDRVHAEHDSPSQVPVDPGAEVTVSRGHAADDHPHFELTATLPGKPLLAYAVAAHTVLRLLLDSGSGLRVPAATPYRQAPLPRNHGPPPPTRAPPLL